MLESLMHSHKSQGHIYIYIYFFYFKPTIVHILKKKASPLFNDFLHEISLNLFFFFIFFFLFFIFKETHRLLYTSGEMVIYTFFLRFFSLYDQNM